MALSKPQFINQFQKGSSETANMGFGAMVGVETYTVKGVARLTKDSIKVSGSVVTDLPIYFTSHTESDIFAQGDTGKVYRSSDFGSTWSDITNPANTLGAGAGRGLIFFEGYLFEFFNGEIHFCSASYGSGDWSPFKTGLNGDQNFPMLFPNDGFVYFGNANAVGKFGFGNSTTFNPTGTSGVDYFYSPSFTSNGQPLLPAIYEIRCMSFLPSNFIALGTGSSGIGNSSQVADVILWNPTLSTYETPLRLFSQAGAGAAGVNQIINRNNVLYAVTGGNHAIFATNGTSYTLLDDVSLYTTGRLIPPFPSTGTGTGEQATAPIFINQYPSAIAVMGNKLMTGVSTSILSLPSGYGNFPCGVWSEAFAEDGNSLQCEFTISSGIVISTRFSIGALYPVNQGQLLIGWYDGTNYGIDKTEYQNYQNDDSVVMVESEMMEIGTPLEPSVITTIQENLVRSVRDGQTISVYWRDAYDQPYNLLETFDSSNGDVQLNNSLKTLKNEMGAIKFLQLKLSMKTGDPNLAWTPELRNIIVTGK